MNHFAWASSSDWQAVASASRSWSRAAFAAWTAIVQVIAGSLSGGGGCEGPRAVVAAASDRGRPLGLAAVAVASGRVALGARSAASAKVGHWWKTSWSSGWRSAAARARLACLELAQVGEERSELHPIRSSFTAAVFSCGCLETGSQMVIVSSFAARGWPSGRRLAASQ